MKALLKNLVSTFSSPEEAPLSEAERLLAELEETRGKMEYAWCRLDDAAPEYVEIAVLELLLLETQYSLLNKRYRLLLGIEDSPFSVEGQHQNRAFYSSLFSSNATNPSVNQWVTRNQ
ncbi:hypothetical protein [Desulfosporosinus sp. Sb-LF]|uniref:hypothetical protein n=1 Tax=Desulfosporosinus sp. Sb-LF TaxID=2560027 RepID=UPI00107F2BF2|nr:hypothetical protein [Desulfosporosinus sp. Sb-LF]TGE31999.1 hypothetical protein E4K68_15105 [Desulfosporosinus sp. Sb-LF]